MPPLFLLLLACLAATTPALRLFASVSRPSIDCVERTSRLIAQWGMQPLPHGWEVQQDEHGQVYYYNEQSGQCQWDVPLPPGWVGHQDEQGRIYYCNEQSGQCQWDLPTDGNGLNGQDEETVTYIAERLQEPQLRIVRAVVQFLGSQTALELLAQTEQVQAAGGMVVPETGKPRTNGGVYLQLLKSATNMPREAQDAALRDIKAKGKNVKSWEKASVPGWS